MLIASLKSEVQCIPGLMSVKLMIKSYMSFEVAEKAVRVVIYGVQSS